MDRPLIYLDGCACPKTVETGIARCKAVEALGIEIQCQYCDKGLIRIMWAYPDGTPADGSSKAEAR